jgi:hypothetical protein
LRNVAQSPAGEVLVERAMEYHFHQTLIEAAIYNIMGQGKNSINQETLALLKQIGKLPEDVKKNIHLRLRIDPNEFERAVNLVNDPSSAVMHALAVMKENSLPFITVDVASLKQKVSSKQLNSEELQLIINAKNIMSDLENKAPFIDIKSFHFEGLKQLLELTEVHDEDLMAIKNATKEKLDQVIGGEIKINTDPKEPIQAGIIKPYPKQPDTYTLVLWKQDNPDDETRVPFDVTADGKLLCEKIEYLDLSGLVTDQKNKLASH